jgi:hypothetical protein
MSEPSYGSGQAYDPQQGYGGTPGYGQQYGGDQAAAPGQPGQPGQSGQPYGSGQQPQSAPSQYGSYGQQQPGAGGYQSGSYQAASSGQTPYPGPPRTPADRLGLAATVVTIVGYVCAGAGLLGFILWLTVDGDGTYRFATALETLVIGIGLGGVNYALGTWLAGRSDR